MRSLFLEVIQCPPGMQRDCRTLHLSVRRGHSRGAGHPCSCAEASCSHFAKLRHQGRDNRLPSSLSGDRRVAVEKLEALIIGPKLQGILVGARGFEPRTPCAQGKACSRYKSCVTGPAFAPSYAMTASAEIIEAGALMTQAYDNKLLHSTSHRS
jgi:hypothetical protein